MNEPMVFEFGGMAKINLLLVRSFNRVLIVFSVHP